MTQFAENYLKYSMNDVMHQALSDEYSVVLDGNGYEARLLYGCKISRDNETMKVTIQNTTRAGDWYSPVSDDDIYIFLQKGWRIGVYELSLSNYRLKLDKVEESIKREVNGRKNPKQIQSLKNARQNIMNRYSKIKYKLNQISDGKTEDSKHQG